MLRLFFCFIFVAYLAFLPGLHRSLQNRPLAVKAGYMPKAEILRMTSGEFSTLLADYAVVRTLFYFGTIFDLNQRNVTTRPEYAQMYHNLVQALKLDPYNQDIYYFAQATFTWDVGRIRETNKILEYGLNYRVWDWQLPFWLGFNHAYFLKQYDQAAVYFKKAAELSGNDLFTRLAARFYYEAGQEQLGIAFLDTMIQGARDERIRKLYQNRKDALVAVRSLREAVSRYQARFGHRPANLRSLVEAGLLEALPVDPYGGTFYLDEAGQVRSTSKFAQKGAAEGGGQIHEDGQ